MVITLPDIRKVRTIDAIRALRRVVPSLLVAKRCIENAVAQGRVAVEIAGGDDEVAAAIQELGRAGFKAEIAP